MQKGKKLVRHKVVRDVTAPLDENNSRFAKIRLHNQVLRDQLLKIAGEPTSELKIPQASLLFYGEKTRNSFLLIGSLIGNTEVRKLIEAVNTNPQNTALHIHSSR